MTARTSIVAAGVVALLLVPVGAQAQDGSGNGSIVPWLAAVGVGLSVLLFAILFAGLGLRAIERDVRGRLGTYARTSAEGLGWLGRIPGFRWLARSAEEAAARRGVLDAVGASLERAGLPLRPGEGLAVAVGISVLAGLLFGVGTRNLLVGLGVGALGIVVVVMGTQAAAAREQRRFEQQMPDTLNLIASSLRAGYSLLQAVEAVADESRQPTRREFGRALSEIRLGQSVTVSLRRLAHRMGSVDFEWTVMAIEIQAEVGGNLAEVLQNAAETIVLRTRLRRDVRAMTAEGRISAVVLLALPFALLGFLWATNRDYLDPLLDSTLGRVALVGAGVLLVVGILWIRKIVDIKA